MTPAWREVRLRVGSAPRAWVAEVQRPDGWVVRLSGAAQCFAARKLRDHGWDLVKTGFRARKMMFFMQNFQDRDNLDQDRIDLCSFHVMTKDGPVSMCLHNANRDTYILPENQPGVYPEGTKPVLAASATACSSCTGCH